MKYPKNEKGNYKIVATTKEGVVFTNKLNDYAKKVMKIVIELEKQGLEVEVYKIEKIYG